MNRAASAAQLPTTAGGAITSAGPCAGRAGEVGEHRRRLAEAHVEREAAAEPDGVEEAEPAERLGLVAAQLAGEAVRLGDDRLGETVAALSSRSAAQPLPSTTSRRRAPSPRGRPRGAGSRRR